MNIDMVNTRLTHDGTPRLKILSLNCWGLKYVSQHRVERIHAIADYIATSSTVHSRNSSVTSLEALAESSAVHEGGAEAKVGGYDVVCLQELWVQRDFAAIKERVKEAGLIYSKRFYSAALGSGLAILSRYPILESHFWAYSLNGHPLHFIQGDFFVGKSVGSVLVNVPNYGEVEVFTTHLYAPYDVPAPEWKRAHRTVQAWQLARLTRASAERGRTVLVCGDLNSVPSSLPITVIMSHGALRDAWSSLHPGNPTLSAGDLTYRSAIKAEGITCDSMINTFTAGKNPKDRGMKGFGKRLDYILFRPGLVKVPSTGGWEDMGCVTCDDCRVTMTEPIPIMGFSYSDHFALEATFTLQPRPLTTLPSPQRPPSPLTSLQINAALSALYASHRSSQHTSTIHFTILALCLLFIPGIAVAASFQPLSYLNWIFTLLSVAVGAIGSTMLYVGFVAGRWERNSIQEVCEEMELYLAKLKVGGS